MPTKPSQPPSPKKHKRPHARYSLEFSEAVERLSGAKPHKRKKKVTAKKKAKKKK